eukprot:7063995-Prymnesium_polylepis.1
MTFRNRFTFSPAHIVAQAERCARERPLSLVRGDRCRSRDSSCAIHAGSFRQPWRCALATDAVSVSRNFNVF